MTYKIEHKPLFDNGFKEIGIWQLDNIFLEPFGENEHRKYLIDRLTAYLNELSFIGLKTEVWIDGSFATHKPEPEDIDIALLFNPNEVDNLDERRLTLLDELVRKRDIIKARYSCDVYYLPNDNEEVRNTWIETYGYDSNKMNTKGIFKLYLNQDV